jgi:hypothetical protein
LYVRAHRALKWSIIASAAAVGLVIPIYQDVKEWLAKQVVARASDLYLARSGL